ncbi:hypothetical protein PCANC_25691 [Puccinia coronata f. sp. avenae]|uniref:J domain-containing protein n=1 Tax=Puccinia coronata f. sp. avenae TaxID=200324 RepID=A0A2N5TAC7_9BASI|nr:hypothetical protein PCANC_25691 [Puccinia coronata f. sp. avenae]
MSPTIIQSRPREPHEYLPPPSSNSSKEPYLIQCHSCSQTFSPNSSAGPNVNSTKPSAKKTGRRIGSDERPLETEYYDVLSLTPKATPVEIKAAYRRMALKMHPDKNPNDPDAGEKFKALAVAYNTLSDPELRKKYNEFGKQQEGEGDIIGTISLGQEMKAAMQKENDDEEENGPGNELVSTSGRPAAASSSSKVSTKPTLTPEQKAKRDAASQAEAEERKRVREERVSKLVEKLKSKLYIYTEQAQEEFDQQVMDSVKMIWEFEKDSLAEESFGPELLRTVGATYLAKSKRCLTATATGAWGGGVALVGGWFHSAKSTAHVLSETVGAVRAAYDVKAVFDELAKAEAEGGPGLTEERKKELEELAAKKGLRALFMGAKLEVESVIREVCDRLLEEPGVSREVIRKRAVGLGILGSVFETAKNKNGEDTLTELASGYANKVDPIKKGAESSTTAKDSKTTNSKPK